MILPTEKWVILIVRQRREIQGRIGFYKCGVKNKEEWYGLTLPYIDIRFVKFLQWGIPQSEALEEKSKKENELRYAANKLVLCFPGEIPEGMQQIIFNIPAYVVRELKQALQKETKE